VIHVLKLIVVVEMVIGNLEMVSVVVILVVMVSMLLRANGVVVLAAHRVLIKEAQVKQVVILAPPANTLPTVDNLFVTMLVQDTTSLLLVSHTTRLVILAHMHLEPLNHPVINVLAGPTMLITLPHHQVVA